MRFFWWLVGLAVLAGGAYLYRPIADFGIETWMTVGIVAATWSIVMFTSTVVDRIVAPDDGDSRGVFTALLSLAFASMGGVFVLAVHAQAAEKNWGTFGDFLGGVLNPVLTFLSFMALLFTIILQQREVHGAKEDAKVLQGQRHADRLSSERMQFENTFFQMVSIHNTIVNSIDVDRGPSKNQLRGRECFKHFRDVMQAFYDADHSPDVLKKSLAAHDHLWKSYTRTISRTIIGTSTTSSASSTRATSIRPATSASCAHNSRISSFSFSFTTGCSPLRQSSRNMSSSSRCSIISRRICCSIARMRNSMNPARSMRRHRRSPSRSRMLRHRINCPLTEGSRLSAGPSMVSRTIASGSR